MVYIHIARFLFGVADDMAFVAAPMYIAEIAESKIRGFLSSVVYLMMLVGFVIVYSIGPYLPFFSTPVFATLVLIIQISIFSFMPESPYYLLFQNKQELARKSLKFFRPNRNIGEELEEINCAIERQKEESGRIRDIFLVKSNRRAIVIMTVLNSGQHLLAISVILMNMHMILDSAGSIYMDSSKAAILFSVIMLSFATVASLNVDKYGRKTLLFISTVSSSFCLLTLAIYFHLKYENVDVTAFSWIPIATVMIYAATFKIGLGIVPSVITAEIFSARVKAWGMTISDAVYVLASIVSIQIYTLLEPSYGIHFPFYLFTGAGFSVALFVLLYVPETKGKTLDEIQLLLKGETHISKKTQVYNEK
ncbi:hypothetical protein JTB14_025129 [Gonioctena quinquepunctata]|nr:hypothetical protein JTB14_025129 [Gonioctena quinquepunctata]